MKQFLLNNNTTAEFKGMDRFDRPTFKYMVKDRTYTLVIVDNKMHSTLDGEPYYPLAKELQLKEYDFDFNQGEFIKKQEVSS